MTTHKDKLCLLVQVFNSEGYFHVRATVGRMLDDREGDSDYREVGCSFITPQVAGGYQIGDLTYNSQGHRSCESLYGTGLVYRNVGHVDLNHLECMRQTLRRIEASMRKLSDRFGYPPNFTEEIMRFAMAIKATHVCAREQDFMPRTGCEGWVTRSLGPEARHMVHAVVYHAMKRFGRQEEEAAAA